MNSLTAFAPPLSLRLVLAGLALSTLAAAQVTTQQARLEAGDAAQDDRFGSAVAIDGATALLGAHFDDHGPWFDAGSAYVFVHSGATWSQQAKLVASDASDGDDFGASVALAGDTALVGAPLQGNFQQGAAYVFVRSGSTWSQQAKLTPSDPGAGDRFGNAVAIQGDTAVVGCYFDDAGLQGSGSAYVFVRSGSTWSQQAKLVATPLQAGQTFGIDVAISDNTIAVGAEPGGLSSADHAVYVFVRSGVSWLQQAQLLASQASSNTGFGGALALSGDTLVASDVFEDDLGGNSGVAYVFQRSGTTWSEVARLLASDGDRNDQFGNRLALDGERMVIGALTDSPLQTWTGSAYVFRRHGTLWVEEIKLAASDAAAFDQFGFDVSISGDAILIGAEGDRDFGLSSGAAYVFADEPGPPGPLLTDVSPARIEALIPGTARTVALAGSALDLATTLTLDGVPIDPARYTRVDSRLLLLDMPQAGRLGELSFGVTDGAHADTHPVTIEACRSPRYELGTGDPDQIVDRDDGLSFILAGRPGSRQAVYVSASNRPSTNAFVSLRIGAQFTELARGGFYTIPAAGWLRVSLATSALPDPGPAVFMAHSQTLELTFPAPLPTSNVQSILLVH